MGLMDDQLSNGRCVWGGSVIGDFNHETLRFYIRSIAKKVIYRSGLYAMEFLYDR